MSECLMDGCDNTGKYAWKVTKNTLQVISDGSQMVLHYSLNEWVYMANSYEISGETIRLVNPVSYSYSTFKNLNVDGKYLATTAGYTPSIQIGIGTTAECADVVFVSDVYCQCKTLKFAPTAVGFAVSDQSDQYPDSGKCGDYIYNKITG